MKKIAYALLVLTLAATVSATVLTTPAQAQLQMVTVGLGDGSQQQVLAHPSLPARLRPGGALPPDAQLYRVSVRNPDGSVNVFLLALPAGAGIDGIRPLLPGQVLHVEALPSAPPQSSPAPASPEEAPEAQGGKGQRTGGKARFPRRKRNRRKRSRPRPHAKGSPRDRHGSPRPFRGGGETRARRGPGFVEGLPGPGTDADFTLRKFRVPAFLLPIYQAASAQYGIRWEILAAINEIETDYGRNLNISSAGAMGWMQFMPATWRAYGGDASGDGRSDPYNPVDAIFAAARYLSAAGYAEDPRKAIFAYNHANWYVDSVLLRARVIAGVPAGILGSLTGITEGRFPVYARSYYADDVADEGRGKRRRAIEIFARRGAPVVAVTEGVVERIGRSRRLGRYVVLRDLYGNRYTYARLGSVARYHAVPESRPLGGIPPAKALGVRGRRIVAPRKERLFANPRMRGARENGGLDQLFELRARKDPRFEKFVNRLSRPLDIDARDIRLKRLRAGSRVLGGTVLGDTGSAVRGKASHLLFSIRPAGSRRATIDAKPILDGWKLLEATGVHAAGSRSVLVDRAHLSLGRMTMLPKRLLERRVLGDERIEIYPCGRRDIRRGLIDRRVLATMVYLAESGLRPTVTSLRCHHSYLTSSGNVSHHSTGGALDIARVNGIPILGHQDRGGIAEQTVRRLTRLKGTMRPAQIISLLSLGGNTVSMADHADHIHVGFSDGAGRGAPDKTPLSTLTPGQWSNVLSRLRDIENPVVRASR